MAWRAQLLSWLPLDGATRPYLGWQYRFPREHASYAWENRSTPKLAGPQKANVFLQWSVNTDHRSNGETFCLVVSNGKWQGSLGKHERFDRNWPNCLVRGNVVFSCLYTAINHRCFTCFRFILMQTATAVVFASRLMSSWTAISQHLRHLGTKSMLKWLCGGPTSVWNQLAGCLQWPFNNKLPLCLITATDCSSVWCKVCYCDYFQRETNRFCDL